MELSQTPKSLLMLILFIFILSTFIASAVASSSSVIRPAKPHIKKACRTTPYPRLCETSLALYASKTKKTKQELCRAAMVSSLKAAQNATSIISKLSCRKGSPSYEVQVIGDCVDNLKDSVDELRRATAAIASLSRAKDVEFQVNSIKTWMSAAETDVMTCTDELSGGASRKVRSTVKKEVKNCSVNVVRQISNALALINNNFKYK